VRSSLRCDSSETFCNNRRRNICPNALLGVGCFSDHRICFGSANPAQVIARGQEDILASLGGGNFLPDVSGPDATHPFAERADTPLREVTEFGGCVAGTIDQLEPFQCSIRGLPTREPRDDPPTAQMSFADTTLTSLRKLPGKAEFGLGTYSTRKSELKCDLLRVRRTAGWRVEPRK